MLGNYQQHHCGPRTDRGTMSTRTKPLLSTHCRKIRSKGQHLTWSVAVHSYCRIENKWHPGEPRSLWPCCDMLGTLILGQRWARGRCRWLFGRHHVQSTSDRRKLTVGIRLPCGKHTNVVADCYIRTAHTPDIHGSRGKCHEFFCGAVLQQVTSPICACG